ncbi:MAG TPA: heparinase II/III family protein, partial [Patescibacteria group bacterium]|nr:heparinase II/III family protein [Patescibacteria group bacterium]
MNVHEFRDMRLLARRAGVCLMLCMFCLAADLRASAWAQRNTQCLTENFYLYECVDLELEVLRRARSHFEKGEIDECDREILSYFSSRKGHCRLEPWGTRPHAVQEAESILDNSYKFWLYDRYELPADLTWRENPARSRNWVFFLLSFDFLGVLNEAFAITGDRRFLERGRELIIDFKEDNYNPERLPSRDLSWYEHTVAIRALFLLDFWQLSTDDGAPDSTFTGTFLDLLWRHARFLEADCNYTGDSNHGIFNAAAMLRISLLFPEFREASHWRAVAVQRLESQLFDNVTGDGIHAEYSPWYQIWVAGVLEQIRRDCRMNGIRISKEVGLTIARLSDAIPHLFHPDGTIALFGDSDAFPSMPYQDLALSRLAVYRYIRSGGRYGPRPRERTREFPIAGFYSMRSGWGKKRPLKEETCLLINLSGRAKQHDHYDNMGFEFSAKGQKWVTDLGRWAYEHGDIRRRFIISPMAHNIVVPHSLDTIGGSGKRGQVVPLETKRGGEDHRRPGRVPLRRTFRRDLPKLNDRELLNLIAGVSLSDSAAIQAVIDTISAIRDIDTKIAACRRLLSRNPRGFVDKLELHLAFCLGEEKNDITSARRYLEDIIEYGTDDGAQTVARELLALYVQQQGEAEGGNEETTEAPEQPSVLTEEKPNMQAKPDRYHWISRRGYDYLEAGVQYRKGYFWSRAFLFIKPYHLLVIDVIQSDTPRKAKQLFHMPPSVGVTRDGDRYLLSTDDSLRCIVKSLFVEPEEEYSIIKGQKTPNYQGW